MLKRKCFAMRSILAFLCLLALSTSTMALTWQERAALRKQKEKETRELLKKEGSAPRIVQMLLSESDAETLNDDLARFGEAVHKAKAYETAGQVFDELLKKGDLQSTLLAADFMYQVVKNIPTSSYGATRESRDFPDSLCERAAGLLDHNDPVVQAIAEWTLANRVKKVNAGTRKMDELMLPSTVDASWYNKWRNRPRSMDLQDDYGRQLFSLGRHADMEGLKLDLGKIEGRMEKLLAAPASAKVGAEKTAFDQALAAAKKATNGSDLVAAHQAYIDLRMAARKVVEAARNEFPSEGITFYTNPRITGGVWNVNVVVTGRTNIPAGDIYVKNSADPANEGRAMEIASKLEEGSVRGLDLHWDGDRMLFSWWHQPIDDSVQPFGWQLKSANLYEIDLDGENLKQITKSPYNNDVEPCYLPNGGYFFASDRSKFGNQCAGPFLQNKICTTLYRLDPGSEQPIAISNNKDFDRHPHVLNDGTVVFMRWEYQERDIYTLHNAWNCRPDGTSMDAFYKQHISTPASIRDVRQAPDSQICVATVQGHHDAQDGPVVIFNPSLGINNTDAMWNVTPGTSPVERGLGPLEKQIVPEGGVENNGGYYINPFPMSEKAFLVGHDMMGDESEFGIYYIDVWGNRELLHMDPDMSAFVPYPLRKRVTPPVVADTVNPDLDYGTVFLENAYRDLPGVDKGAVKHLRVSQRLFLPAPVDYEQNFFNHLHYLPGDSTSYHFSYWTWAPTRTVGIVDVEPDGSAYFKVPAGTPIFLQALDENYCEIRRERTFWMVQRGEFRGCTGCHESRLEAVGTKPVYPKATLDKGPQTPEPPSWGINTVLDYRTHVQPILDKHCLSCHGQDDPAGGLEFTKRETGGFMQSYRTMFGLKWEDPTPVLFMKWHQVLHPEAKDDKYTVEKKNGKYPDRGDRATRDIIKRMEQNQWPGMLVSISNRHDDSAITMPYQFGSNKSKLIRTLLDDKKHSKIREKMSDEEWLRLVTWVDYNAIYHTTVINVREYSEQNQVLTRVPYYLPTPWKPADINPSFMNTADVKERPEMPEGNEYVPR